MTRKILHITHRSDWESALQAGAYTTDSLPTERFIHCSTPSQALRVADLLFRGQQGLVLLVIDPSRLTAELRWEPGVDLATDLFPHVYGPIDLDAVREVLEFEPAADGTFSLPASLVP